MFARPALPKQWHAWVNATWCTKSKRVEFEVLVTEARQCEHFVPSHCLRSHATFESEVTEKLRMPRVTTTVMNTLLVKSHTLFLPELSEGQLVEDGHHALEEWPVVQPIRNTKCCSLQITRSSSEHDRNSGERSDPAWLDERHQVPGTRIVESCATVRLRLAALG